MKANAPKKIYIPRLEGNKSFVNEWSATKFRKYFSREIAENVEYIRTDAFIEKAQLFLIDKLKEIPMGNGKMKIKADCSLEKFIEEFKKAMKE